MKITRRVDDLGRVVIPREMRESLGIVEGAPVELCYSGLYKNITISKKEVEPNYKGMWRELKENSTISPEVFRKLESKYAGGDI